MRSFMLTSLALLFARPALAADVTLQLSASDGFVIHDNAGTVERLRVDEATRNISRNGALFVHRTGATSIVVGRGAGTTAASGPFGGSAFGHDALRSNTTGHSNSAFGAEALRNTATSDNSAFGSFALRDNTTTRRSARVRRSIVCCTTPT